jgi:membrane associated rhomboid family serine protease
MEAGARKRPKMPSKPWRLAAVCCIAIGAIGAWLLFRGSDTVALRAAVGGAIGFVVGMYIVETVWERRVARSVR